MDIIDNSLLIDFTSEQIQSIFTGGSSFGLEPRIVGLMRSRWLTPVSLGSEFYPCVTLYYLILF